MARPFLGKRGYLWITLALFVVSLAAQFIFSWAVYAQDQEEHQQPIEVGGYLATTLKDMFENWQSEFLQLLWQVFGLSVLWAVGSPQSKEGDERKEAKLYLLMDRVLGEKEAARHRRELEERYPSQ